MQTFLKWAAISTVVLAACGGNVVVDGPATGTGNETGYGGTTSVGYGGYGGYYDTSVTGYGGYGGYGDTGGGYSTGFGGGYPDGGDCMSSCGQWLLSGGDDLCEGVAAGAQENLLSCACGSSPCATACGYNVCQYEPISAPCEQCLQSACAAELSDCENN